MHPKLQQTNALEEEKNDKLHRWHGKQQWCFLSIDAEDTKWEKAAQLHRSQQ